MATAEAPPASTASSEAANRTTPAPRPAPRPARRFSITAPLYLLPATVLYGLFVLWPLVRVVWLAVHASTGFNEGSFVGLQNFQALMDDTLFHYSLVHSAEWEVAAASVPTALGLGLALLLMRTRGRAAALAVLFFPALLPATVVAAIWVLVYSPASGLLVTLLTLLGRGDLVPDALGDPHLALKALFVAWLWSSVGITALVLWHALRSIAREYTDIALLEGAGAWWRFRRITLPGIRRMLGIMIVINLALGSQVFDLVFTTTGGGPGYETMVLPLEIYSRAFGGWPGQGAAAACMQIVLGLALLLLVVLVLRRPGESLNSDGQPDRVDRPSWLATAATACVLILVLLPLAWLLVAAVQPGRVFALGVGTPGLDPRTWTGDNVATVWNAGMANAVATSLGFAVAVVAGGLLLAIPAAFALARCIRKPIVRVIALVLLVLGLLQPTAVTLIPLFAVLRDLSLLNTPWGIILPEIARSLPFAVLLIWGFMAQSPREVLDAAAVDGATSWRQMLSVAVPLARPAVIASAVWLFVSSWNEYLLPTLVSQDGSIMTVPTLLGTFIGSYNTQFGALAAGCILGILPSLIFYLLVRGQAAAGLRRAERNVQ